MSQILVGTAANDGTGDPIRTAFQKVNQSMFDCFNVRAYGAKGDGTTDDYAAIVATMAAAQAATGGIIMFPAGTYNISATLTPPAGVNLRFVGAGRGSSFIRHATGGQVINWVQSHLTAEYGSGLEDLSFSGNGGTPATGVINIETVTFFHMSRCEIRNNNVVIAATGLRLLEWWDSEIHDVYVTDCGNATNPCVVLDTPSSGVATFNNCDFYKLHIEPGGINTTLLSMLGGSGREIQNMSFYGLKTHGDPAAGNQASVMVNISQYCNNNHFDNHLLAFGSGTAQVVCAGLGNNWTAPQLGTDITHKPTYGFQFTATSSNNSVLFARSLTGSMPWGTSFFRCESGSIHNRLLFPGFNGLSQAQLFSDAGRNVVIWDDVSLATGLKFYASDGLATVQPGWVQIGVFTFALTDAATVAWDVSSLQYGVLTCTAGVGATRAIGLPTNPQKGQRITLTVIQDGVGGRAVTWNAVFKVIWSDTGNTLNKRSSISFIYDGTNWNQDGAQTTYV